MLNKKILTCSAIKAGGLLAAVLSPGTCFAGAVSPEQLRTPTTVTCIYLPERLAYLGVPREGVRNEAYFEKGPYISEKEDDNGTYYRAPPGAHAFRSNWSKDTKPFLDVPGGIWIPRNPTAMPSFYYYITNVAVPAVTEPVDYGDCSTASFIKDPKTAKISLAAFASAGALGAAGAKVPTASPSYGQAAAGGAIAGFIVGAFINADLGKIVLRQQALIGVDTAFSENLKKLGAHPVVIQEGRPTSPPPASPTTAAPQ